MWWRIDFLSNGDIRETPCPTLRTGLDLDKALRLWKGFTIVGDPITSCQIIAFFNHEVPAFIHSTQVIWVWKPA